MQPRLNIAADVLKGANRNIGQIVGAIWAAGLPPALLHLLHLRVSQINGCSYCTEAAGRQAAQAGESVERLLSVAAWRDAPYFTEAERAALALAEAMTRLADREDPVPDAIWGAAAAHFDERLLPALLYWIGMTNMFNRLNVANRLPAGTEMDWA